MKKLLLHPCYFGPVSFYVALVHADVIVFENDDNYQKQTYRNRMNIYGANGKLQLNIPIKHTGNKSQHQKYREVRIENDFPWQKEHWKSLETVYRTSPFFEFYEDDFRPIYEQPYTFLLDFNYDCLKTALETLQMDINYEKTEEYIRNPEEQHDARFLVNAKGEKSKFGLEPYPQVFETKFGYLNNLSIVDLIFNEGPNAINYLKNQELSFL